MTHPNPVSPSPRRCRFSTASVTAAVALTAATLLLASPGIVRAQNAGGGAEKPVTLGIEAEAFQFVGDWQPSTGAAGASGTGMNILTGGQSGAPHNPAVTAVDLPRAGHYWLWVRTLDFPYQNPGTRLFQVSVGGHAAPHPFGASGKAKWTWENGGEYDLPAGRTLIALRNATPYARADALLLTTDLGLVPGTEGLGHAGLPRAAKPAALPLPEGPGDPLAAPGPVMETGGGTTAAAIENEFVRVQWLPARESVSGKATVVPRVSVRASATAPWRELTADPAAEAYAVIAGKAPNFRFSAFYPVWDDARNVTQTLTLTANGVSETTLMPNAREAIWSGGQAERMLPQTAAPSPGKTNTVRLTFYSSPDGDLVADWSLEPGDKTPRVALTFTPKTAGSYALGYETPWRKPLADVPELLLPPTYERRRFPAEPRTSLDCLTPTPLALAQSREARPQTWGVSGDPVETPFAWPNFKSPNFGLMIRDGGGFVHPAIYGPVPGTAKAKRDAGQTQTFHFRLLVSDGDWYSAYRIAADDVYGFRDYRENDPRGSLTDAVLNMIDLFKNDKAGGWWPEAKANVQIESRNGSTDCAPLIPMSLYLLTGDDDILRRRALPTLEFLTSRQEFHFSPTYDVDATYPVGGMTGGPSKAFGAPVYGGLWQQTDRRTAVFGDWAFPTDGSALPTGHAGHSQLFDDYVARYEITGDKAALAKAESLADEYLKNYIAAAPTGDLGWEPFFYISYVPDWDGLLRLYEASGEKRYLDAAAFGARQLMTGVWTQPLVPAGKTPVNDEGQFMGEGHLWWYKDRQYRLGFPRKPNDTPVREVDAWRVSNVGLSFEQPSTYKGGGGPGQMIYQSVWAPGFLQLARYTGDKTFETYARNAVVGRWTNYPGYYATGLTDIHMAPDYPYVGPDVSSIYYHHIPSHLGWTIDYLVSEAELRTHGAVSFPSLEQLGYAYFVGRVFGHAPGKIGTIPNAYLWFKRGLVTLDNPQINYLTAHAENGKRLLVLLMNESSRPEKVSLTLDAKLLGLTGASKARTLDIIGRTPGRALPLTSGKTPTITVAPRGFVTVSVENCRIDVPVTQRATPMLAEGQPVAPKAGAAPAYAVVTGEGGREARAAAIQIRPGTPWDAYLWCTANPTQARKVTFRYRIGETGAWQAKDAPSYPFEFSVPVSDPAAVVHFTVSGETADGKPFSLGEGAVAAPK